MPHVILKLQKFEDLGDATRAADDIRNRGEISYVDNSGSTVNLTVGDVTVDNDG